MGSCILHVFLYGLLVKNLPTNREARALEDVARNMPVRAVPLDQATSSWCIEALLSSHR